MSVGRLVRYKGHHRILGALPAILAQAPDARLVLVGSGPYEQPLRAMASRLGVSDRVSICAFGPERRGAMGKLVADADVCCLLSEGESHPVAVMEALGAGTNALVADTSGLSELGHAGLATRSPSRRRPSKSRPQRSQLLRRRRRRRPALPSWDDCAEQLHRLYREVTA